MLSVALSTSRRRVKIIHFSPWADRLVPSDVYLSSLPSLDMTGRVAHAEDKELVQMARLDCDWYGENTRAFSALKHAQLEFLPASVTGANGLVDLAKSVVPKNEEWWLIFDAQNPQKLAPVLAKLLPLLTRLGIRIAWYSFDESSRTTTAFREMAPHLSVLIHDEFPLDPAGRALLRKGCVTVHRSWVANMIPGAVPFNPAPEEKIVFLGSKLGLTDHRRKQLEFLAQTFQDRFVAFHDHSISVAERGSLNRFKVSFCPEGRKFTTAAMGMTHTDRPFWSGCLGMAPVSEDSRNGGRLEDLAEKGLIYRYPHGDLPALKTACERALAATSEERQRIYTHFNHYETVGTVLAQALQAAG